MTNVHEYSAGQEIDWQGALQLGTPYEYDENHLLLCFYTKKLLFFQFSFCNPYISRKIMNQKRGGL